MTNQEIKDRAPKKRLGDKINLTKEELSKIGLQQLNAYKSKRISKNGIFIEF